MVDEPSMRVLVVDDHPIMRVGIAAILKAQPQMVVCGGAGSVAEAVAMFQELNPDITLMDLRLPDGNGVDAIRSIRRMKPQAKIIVLTTYEGDEDIHQALAAGAMGYLIKGMPHEVLVQALLRVHRGNRFLPPPVTRALSSRDPDCALSQREREVLSQMAAGKSNRQIGDSLKITESTVKSHVRIILMRLDVADRTQAVIKALKRGLEHL